MAVFPSVYAYPTPQITEVNDGEINLKLHTNVHLEDTKYIYSKELHSTV